MTISIIRHAMTDGNVDRRFNGRTDDHILKIEKKDVKYKYQAAEAVFSSPLSRCLQTSKLLFGDLGVNVVEGLRECDFGDFEGKNHEQLKDNSEYLKWLDEGWEGDIPNGESGPAFKKRCVAAFFEVAETAFLTEKKNIAVVCHGGTIMMIMSGLVSKENNFYDWYVDNLSGFELDFDPLSREITGFKKISDVV